MDMIKKNFMILKEYTDTNGKGQLLIYNNKATNHKRENGGKKRHLWKIALYKR
ncbi:MAG: hypothetical protein CM15mV8_0580 [Caudoviricetes sp.]|nr:MAG: hypothetical protein CM15mV8_0580 [Caudoviricetes sp.]